MDSVYSILIRMMRERAEYYYEHKLEPAHYINVAMAYDTCADLIEYALSGNLEAIRQYDYFNKENKK